MEPIHHQLALGLYQSFCIIRVTLGVGHGVPSKTSNCRKVGYNGYEQANFFRRPRALPDFLAVCALFTMRRLGC